MKFPRARENEAATDRRNLLKILLLLGPFTVLAAGCDHHRAHEEDEDPFKREGGGY